jgi:response regulator RpfG family c-di-GMP phosphodiesterase
MAVTPDQAETPHTLLLVDDEENILSSLRRLFRKDGYRVLCATSGQEGLALLAKEPGVDVIMSDQRMPQMTGTAFLRQARLLRPDSIRIVLSGYTDLESVTEAINEGAVYKFLTKPWDDEILRLSIREALQHKWAMDENHMLQSMLVEVNTEFASSIEQLNKKLEQERQRNFALAALFHAQAQAVLIVSAQGELIEANQAARELLHINADTLPARLDTLLPELGRDGMIAERLSVDGEMHVCQKQALGNQPDSTSAITLVREHR